jgi:hypothetical protein
MLVGANAGAGMLEIDHIFCFVEPDGDWAQRLSGAGLRLDDGIEHPGQGTRNRRLFMPDRYLEMVWLSDRPGAEGNPLRLDRRADWRTTGASPFGIGVRRSLDDTLDNTLDDRNAFWPYRPPYAPEATIWIHRADEAQPFIFAFDATREQIARHLPRARYAGTPELINELSIREIRLTLPAAPPPLLAAVQPPLVWSVGPPHMEIVVDSADGRVLSVEPTPIIAIRGRASRPA